MKYDMEKVSELAESWINGNKSYVKQKARLLNTLEVCLLVNEIHNLDGNRGIDEIAFSLTTY